MVSKVRKQLLTTMSRTLNPVVIRVAESGHGPFAVLRHVGRKSGRPYRTPLILAPVAEGFVAELTYGPDVAWYRNITAAGSCDVVVHGVSHHVCAIEDMNADDGLRAFPILARCFLRITMRREFRLLRTVAG